MFNLLRSIIGSHHIDKEAQRCKNAGTGLSLHPLRSPGPCTDLTPAFAPLSSSRMQFPDMRRSTLDKGLSTKEGYETI